MKVFIQCPICKTVLLSDWDGNINSRYRCAKCGTEPFFNNTVLPALSVKQPWAYLICAGLKDIENRTWKLPEKYKGTRVLIHAGAKRASQFNNIFTDNQWDAMGEYARVECVLRQSPVSAIIGSVEIVDCVINHPSIWAGKTYRWNWLKGELIEKEKRDVIYNWVLKNPVLFDKPILNIKGQLGFFKPKID